MGTRLKNVDDEFAQAAERVAERGRKRSHEPPPELASLRAPAVVTREWSANVRTIRTCVYCRTIYLTAADATECELTVERDRDC